MKKQEHFYKAAQETLSTRTEKSLTEKVTWFKSWGRKEDSIFRGTLLSTKRRRRKEETMTVLFVPRTTGSVLINNLREVEERMAEETGYQFKLQEKTGMSLAAQLTTSDPFSGTDCRRENCHHCKSKYITGKDKESCTRQSLVYRAVCLTCKEAEVQRLETLGEPWKETDLITTEYIGESCKSLRQRIDGHVSQLNGYSKTSFMLKYILREHGDQQVGDIKFTFEIIRFHQTPLSRMIHEALEIKRSISDPLRRNINSKIEYNRTSLPDIAEVEDKQGKLDEEELE